MIIKYSNERLSNVCQNKNEFIKEYNLELWQNFKKSIMFFSISNNKNLFLVSRHNGLRIEKLNNHKNLGSFRLNKSWRVNFTYNTSVENFWLIQEIIIEKIHNHKY